MSGYVCTFSKVSKDYGGNSIFRDIDLEILENERIGLVGENGGGNMLSQLEARMADPEVASDPDLMTAILDEYGKAQLRGYKNQGQYAIISEMLYIYS